MDSTSPVISRQDGLEIVTGMINHRGEIGPQGFEFAAASAARDGVPLGLPHDGHRRMRTLRELVLRPAKLADAVADDLRDRSTELRIAYRHAFLRAPLPAPRVADPSAVPRRTETNRDQTTPIRNNFRLGAREW
jgi:hypothetical protein